MNEKTDKRRILIALTETWPIGPLWHAALKMKRNDEPEFKALFLADERWQRAASLPFIGEISMISGARREFTSLHAERIVRAAAWRARRQLQQLAAEARLTPAFEILPDADEARIAELISGASNTLVAPSELTAHPLCAVLQRLKCEIVLIEPKETDEEGR